MIKGLGIPYMGGKRQIAPEIVDYICKANPNAKYIYDLFGGGGAISFYALQKKQFKAVYYNEFNTGIVELLKHIKTQGVTAKMYEWVDSETFDKHKKDNDWYGGFLKTCWSFGNNQRSYLFGKEIEDDKRLLHEVVVNKCLKSLQSLPFELDKDYLLIEPMGKRRLVIMDFIKRNVGRLQHLERLQKLQQLQQLENVQQLEKLQRMEQLEITNLSYELVPITTPVNETVIYCDPPYKGTGKYQKDIDHDAFYNWVKNSPYKCYISSYDFDFPCVLEIKHRSTLSSTSNNLVTEKLYCNKPENYKKLTLF
jgi:16S rRNA G966 N2-methylase RsmD